MPMQGINQKFWKYGAMKKLGKKCKWTFLIHHMMQAESNITDSLTNRDNKQVQYVTFSILQLLFYLLVLMCYYHFLLLV